MATDFCYGDVSSCARRGVVSTSIEILSLETNDSVPTMFVLLARLITASIAQNHDGSSRMYFDVDEGVLSISVIFPDEKRRLVDALGSKGGTGPDGGKHVCHRNTKLMPN